MKKRIPHWLMLVAGAIGVTTSAFADTIACVADPVSGVYCGTGYKISVSVSKPASGATIWLSETGGEGTWVVADSFAGYKDACTDKPMHYKVTATGYADATGSANVTVTPKTLTDEYVWAVLPPEEYYTYDGTEKKPGAACGDGEPSIITENDFTISYQDNVNAGTAKVIFTGKNNYAGTVEEEFEIRKAKGWIGGDEPGTGVVPPGGISKYDATAMYDGMWKTIATNELLSVTKPGFSLSFEYAIEEEGQYSADPIVFKDVVTTSFWYKICLNNPNYEDYAHEARLTITNRPVTVTSSDKSKTWDGTPLEVTAEDISVAMGGGLIEAALPAGESFVYGDFGERTDVGTSPATFSVAAGPDTLLSNYAITCVTGVLEVTAIPGGQYGVTLHKDKGELEYGLTTYDSATGTNLPDVVNYEGYSRIGSWNWWVDFAFVGWSTNAWGSQGGRTDNLGFDAIDRIEAGETGDKEFWAYWSYVHTWQVGSPKQSDVIVTLSEYAHTMHVSGTGAMTNGIMTTMARVDWLARMPWYGAFRPYIVDLTIDEGITAIGSYSFQDVGWLERVTLPSTLESVGEGAFLNHHVVKALTIPASVTYLADRAFATSIGNLLGTVTFEGEPPVVGTDVFAGVEAIGFYPARHRAVWEAVFDAEGKWHGLTMVCAGMAGALTVNKTESLLSVSLNAAGSANIDGEEIAVQPELAEKEGFVITEDSVILTVKTIPGYTYELLGAESVTGPYTVLATKQAIGTTTVFETPKDSAKFFKTVLLQ